MGWLPSISAPGGCTYVPDAKSMGPGVVIWLASRQKVTHQELCMSMSGDTCIALGTRCSPGSNANVTRAPQGVLVTSAMQRCSRRRRGAAPTSSCNPVPCPVSPSSVAPRRRPAAPALCAKPALIPGTPRPSPFGAPRPCRSASAAMAVAPCLPLRLHRATTFLQGLVQPASASSVCAGNPRVPALPLRAAMVLWLTPLVLGSVTFVLWSPLAGAAAGSSLCHSKQ